MIRIWHGGDWLKRDLAQPIYGRVVHGSLIPGWLLYSLIIASSPWYFMYKCTGLYVDCMVVTSLLFWLVICWL